MTTLTTSVLLTIAAFTSPIMTMAQGYVQVVTGDAESVSSHQATLKGTALPSGTIDGAWLFFEYGTDTSRLNVSTNPSRIAGADAASISYEVSDLTPGQTYCYRLVFESNVRIEGAMQCFTTHAAGAPFIGTSSLSGVPGSLVRLAGEGFTSASRVFTNSLPVPTSVLNEREISFQVPAELMPGMVAKICVENNGLTSNDAALVTLRSQPQILKVTDSRGREVTLQNPAIVDANGTLTVVIAALGLGQVTNQPGTGIAAKVSPLSEMTARPSVWIGAEAQIDFAGLMPLQIGLYQVNARVSVDAATTSPTLGKLTLGDGSYVFFQVYFSR